MTGLSVPRGGAILLLFLFAAGVAREHQAQERPALQLSGDLVVVMPTLSTLNLPIVQADLQLTETQREQLAEASQNLFDDLLRLRDLDESERPAATAQLGRRYALRIQNLLTGAQQTRAQQVMYQVSGLAMLARHPEAVKRLKLSQEQADQFDRVTQRLLPLERAAMQGGEGLPRVLTLRQEANGRLNPLLSDEQRQEWQEMTGRPLDFLGRPR